MLVLELIEGWIFLICLTSLCCGQEIHTACYGEGYMESYCSPGFVIFPLDVIVEAKQESVCNASYSLTLDESDGSDFLSCCSPDQTGTCNGRYEIENNQTATYMYHEHCIGKTQCLPLRLDRVPTSSLSCDETLYSNFTKVMAMIFICVELSTIGIISENVTLTSIDGTSPLQLWGQNYANASITTSSSGSCSVQTDNCTSFINIQLLDIRLKPDKSHCKQRLELRDENNMLLGKITCDATNWYTSKDHNLSRKKSYIHISMVNQLKYDDGFFWVSFTSTNGSSLSLDCPAVRPTNNCTPPQAKDESKVLVIVLSVLVPIIIVAGLAALVVWLVKTDKCKKCRPRKVSARNTNDGINFENSSCNDQPGIEETLQVHYEHEMDQEGEAAPHFLQISQNSAVSNQLSCATSIQGPSTRAEYDNQPTVQNTNTNEVSHERRSSSKKKKKKRKRKAKTEESRQDGLDGTKTSFTEGMPKDSFPENGKDINLLTNGRKEVSNTVTVSTNYGENHQYESRITNNELQMGQIVTSIDATDNTFHTIQCTSRETETDNSMKKKKKKKKKKKEKKNRTEDVDSDGN